VRSSVRSGEIELSVHAAVAGDSRGDNGSDNRQSCRYYRRCNYRTGFAVGHSYIIGTCNQIADCGGGKAVRPQVGIPGGTPGRDYRCGAVACAYAGARGGRGGSWHRILCERNSYSAAHTARSGLVNLGIISAG
jgi:hypothetical protein